MDNLFWKTLREDKKENNQVKRASSIPRKLTLKPNSLITKSKEKQNISNKSLNKFYNTQTNNWLKQNDNLTNFYKTQRINDADKIKKILTERNTKNNFDSIGNSSKGFGRFIGPKVSL
jgi:hypothetical protein